MNMIQTSPQLSLSEELAFPFLQTALEIDKAGENPDDRHGLIAVMANNAMLWTHLKTQFSRSSEGISGDYIKYLAEMSQFMIKSTFVAAREADRTFLDKVIQINLNMCEQLLTLSADSETAGTA